MLWVYVLYGTRSPATARVARAIAGAVDWSNEREARPVADVNPFDIRLPGVVFLGCESGSSDLDRSIRSFVQRLPERTLYNALWAVFDTRLDPFPRLAGSGIRRLRRAVEHRGGRLLIAPESFPALEPGGGVSPAELLRARTWGSAAIALAVKRFGDPTVRPGLLPSLATPVPWEVLHAAPA